MTCKKLSVERPVFNPRFVVYGVALATLVSLHPARAGSLNPGPAQYTLSDLGTLGGLQSWATKINKKGQVAGDSDTSTGERHAFLWENGVMRDLGTLGGNHSSAVALNERGQVAGTSTLATGEEHAFLWTDGVMQDLGTLPGGDQSWAMDLNDSGEVAGFSLVLVATPSGPVVVTHGFLWDGSSMIDVGTLGSSGYRAGSAAQAINKSGQVVGTSSTSSGVSHAFLWTDGRMTDLTALSGVDLCDDVSNCWESAWGINDQGDVIGESGRLVQEPTLAYETIDAVLWSKGTRTVLGAGDRSYDYGVAGIGNMTKAFGQHGEVIGVRRAHNGVRPSYGFLWQAGVRQEWTLGNQDAWVGRMNKAGQVTGGGHTPDGQSHGYVWQAGILSDLGEGTAAWDINDHGLLVGALYTPSLINHAALWSPVGPPAP